MGEREGKGEGAGCVYSEVKWSAALALKEPRPAADITESRSLPIWDSPV